MRKVATLIGLGALVASTAVALLAWPSKHPVTVDLPEPCADGDPCTLDRWHAAQRRCLHLPDPLCTKPCRADADCAYPAEVAPCLDARCHEGACRYMKIAVDECVRCDSGTPCAGTFCDPRECKGGFCRHAPRSCDDGDPHTRDRCDPAGCRHDLGDGLRACHQDQDCVTDHPCERLQCRGGQCRVTDATARCGDPLGSTRACKANTDCIEKRGDTCFAGPCRGGYCEWRKVENSRCEPCTGDHDCTGTFCDWPICTGTVCVTEQVPFCLDDNPATEDTCSDALRGCIHRWTVRPPKCASPARSDGDPNTVDFCHTETGETVYLPSDGTSCGTRDLCWTVYTGADGLCLGRPLECHHDDSCPAECDPNAGCVLNENQDCHCTQDADCDLGNPCARVYCMPSDGGACWGTFIDHCIPCKSDADCLADDWCVLGTCASDGYCVYQDGRTCDDGDPTTFGFCHGQRDDPCSHEPLSPESHR